MPDSCRARATTASCARVGARRRPRGSHRRSGRVTLALAFGISSGVGAAARLITAVVAGLVAAVFGGSHVQVSGPTGAMAVILAPIVAEHGIGSIAIVTIMSGLIVLVAGVVGLGGP